MWILWALILNEKENCCTRHKSSVRCRLPSDRLQTRRMYTYIHTYRFVCAIPYCCVNTRCSSRRAIENPLRQSVATRSPFRCPNNVTMHTMRRVFTLVRKEEKEMGEEKKLEKHPHAILCRGWATCQKQSEVRSFCKQEYGTSRGDATPLKAKLPPSTPRITMQTFDSA